VTDRSRDDRTDAGRAVGSARRSDEKRTDRRAKSLEHGGEGHEVEGDPEAAERAAEAILEESEERTFDEAPRDPEDDSVPRRSSEETT